jgi:hypothetical protein
VLRIAVLQPEDARGHIGRNVLDVRRVHGLRAVRRHEDLHGFVVIAVGALVERTLDAFVPPVEKIATLASAVDIKLPRTVAS